MLFYQQILTHALSEGLFLHLLKCIFALYATYPAPKTKQELNRVR